METRLNENERAMQILIVDPVAHSRDSLATYLGLQECFEVVAKTATASEAIDLTRHYKPDVVIMDVNLSGVDGFAATRHLVALEVAPTVILLTVHRRVRDQLQAQKTGASAYIEKSAGVDAILDALHKLANYKTKES